MQTKTLQQTITFKASPQEVYDMLMDSRKHQSLSGEPAKISKKVGGKFTAWGSHLSGMISPLIFASTMMNTAALFERQTSRRSD